MNFNAILYGCLWFPVILWANPIHKENNLNSSEEVGTIRYPGTNFCGPNSKTNNFTELGKLIAEDRCCKAHDNCDDQILPGQSMHGLTNRWFFTAVTCKCDDDFPNCLSNVNSFHSAAIAALYAVSLPECFIKVTVSCADAIKGLVLQFRCSRLDDEQDLLFWSQSSLVNNSVTTITTPVTIIPVTDTPADILKEVNSNVIENGHENEFNLPPLKYNLPPPQYPQPQPNYYPWGFQVCCVDVRQMQHLT